MSDPYREASDKPQVNILEWWEETPPTDEEKEFWVKTYLAFIAIADRYSYPLENNPRKSYPINKLADMATIQFRRRFHKSI